MTHITIEEAQAHLPQLIDKLQPGEELIITKQQQPVARLVAPLPAPPARKLGSLKGSVIYMAPDFDAPLDDFKEHMQ